MARQRSLRLAALAAVLAASPAVADDLFLMLAPDKEFAVEVEPASAEPAPAVVEITDDSQPAAPAGVQRPDELDSLEVAFNAPPIRAPRSAQPISVVIPNGPGVIVTDGKELIPMPMPMQLTEPVTIGPIDESDPFETSSTVTTPTGSPGPAPTTTLSRSILGLTLDAGADPELVSQMSKIPEKFAIKDVALDRFGSWDGPAAEASQAPPRFAGSLFNFAAPAVYTRPLYFEQPNLERYGHHVACCDHDNLTQSALSAAHFFATVPVLPYKMGAEHPDECSYVLGTYRPGSCNPHQLLKPQLSVGGSVLEGVAVTGLIFLIP